MKKTTTLLFALVLLGVQGFAQIIPHNGLISHLSFNGDANADYGSVNGVVTGATFTEDRFGNPDHALAFNDAGTYVSLGDNFDNYLSTSGSGQITYSFWAYFTSVNGGYQTLIAKSGDSNCGINARQLVIRLNPSNKIEVIGYGSLTSGNYVGVEAITQLAAQRWYHIMVTYNEGEIAPNGSANAFHIYIDGMTQSTSVNLSFGGQLAVSNGILDGAAHMGMGVVLDHTGAPCYTTNALKGKMDDLRIYSAVLGQAEALKLYNEADPIPPVATFNFDNSTPLDVSGNNLDGTAYNVSTAHDRFGNASSAVGFNGTDSYINLYDGLLVNDQLSISLWFKTTTGGGILGYQSGAYPNAGSDYVPIFYVGPSSYLHATLWQGFVGDLNENNTTAFNDGQWHHLVIACEWSGYQSFYIDNVVTGGVPSLTVLASLIKSQLGAAYTGGGWPDSNNGWYFYNGAIDDLNVYYRRITAAEVNELYNAGNPITAVNDMERKAFSIYPNPAESALNIVTDAQWDNATIVDALGRTVASFNSKGGKQLDISKVESGVYFIQLTNKGERIATERVIVK